MLFSGPRFPKKSPQMGEGQFFPTLPQKMPILFHSGNKTHFKLCSKSVSNYQNQLVEAEKLFKKSHIWFHCRGRAKRENNLVPKQKLKIWYKAFRSALLLSFRENRFCLSQFNKEVKFDGARCPFSTFFASPSDCHYACAWFVGRTASAVGF